MDLISTSWTCLRCGAAYISTPPDSGLCDQCIRDLEAIARLAPVANQPCPACGGPVRADCGKALITLIPIPPAGLAKPAREVNGDGR
jgi:predicted amidophosphoribosyltransferase